MFDSFITVDCPTNVTRFTTRATTATTTTIATTAPPPVDAVKLMLAIAEQIQQHDRPRTTSSTTTPPTPLVSRYSYNRRVVDPFDESLSYQYLLPSVVQFSDPLFNSYSPLQLPRLALINDYLVKLTFFGDLMFMQILDDIDPQIVRQNRVTQRFKNRVEYLTKTSKTPDVSIHRVEKVLKRSRRGLPNPFGPLVQTDIKADVSTANKHNISIVEVGPNGTITHNNNRNETKEGKVETSNVSHGSTVTIVRGNGDVNASKGSDLLATIENLQFLMNGLARNAAAAVSTAPAITTTRTTTTTTTKITTTTTTTTVPTSTYFNHMRHARHGRDENPFDDPQRGRYHDSRNSYGSEPRPKSGLGYGYNSEYDRTHGNYNSDRRSHPYGHNGHNHYSQPHHESITPPYPNSNSNLDESKFYNRIYRQILIDLSPYLHPHGSNSRHRNRRDTEPLKLDEINWADINFDWEALSNFTLSTQVERPSVVSVTNRYGTYEVVHWPNATSEVDGMLNVTLQKNNLTVNTAHKYPEGHTIVSYISPSSNSSTKFYDSAEAYLNTTYHSEYSSFADFIPENIDHEETDKSEHSAENQSEVLTYLLFGLLAFLVLVGFIAIIKFGVTTITCPCTHRADPEVTQSVTLLKTI